MIYFSPDELRIILDEIQTAMAKGTYYEEDIPKCQSIEWKIERELNKRTADYEEI